VTDYGWTPAGASRRKNHQMKKFLILHKIIAELRVGRKIVISGHIHRIFRRQFSIKLKFSFLRFLM